MDETAGLNSASGVRGTVAGMSPDLVGFGELPKLLGVSRATAARLAKREDFPVPIEQLASGRVWRRRDVERWAKKHPPRGPGRPPAE